MYILVLIQMIYSIKMLALDREDHADNGNDVCINTTYNAKGVRLIYIMALVFPHISLSSCRISFLSFVSPGHMWW